MGYHYRFIFSHDEYRRLVSLVEDKLDGLHYQDDDFDALYHVHCKLSQPRQSSQTTLRLNLRPVERDAIHALIVDTLQEEADTSADLIPLTRLRLKIHDAKRYVNQ